MNKLKEYMLEIILETEGNFDIRLSRKQREQIIDNHYNELRRGIDDLIYDAVSDEVE